MTALGIALTVTTAVFPDGAAGRPEEGFHVERRSGERPRHAQGLCGRNFLEASTPVFFPTLKTLPGIAKDGQGEPLASGEWVVVVVLPRKDGTGEVNVSVRGLMPAGLTLRPNAKLVEGRWFAPGQTRSCRWAVHSPSFFSGAKRRRQS